VLCQAKSGMGKTAVFVIATLQQLDLGDEKTKDDVQVLVMAHTRELAYQIHGEFKRFSKHLAVRAAVFYGGQPETENINTLKNDKPQIVVGTPGRIVKLVRDKKLNLSKLKHFILDECDQMLEKAGIELSVVLGEILN